LAIAFQAMASRSHGMGGPGGQAVGLALIYQTLMAHAASLSYLDTYVVLGTGSATMFFLSFLLQSNDPKHTEVKSGH
jgi:hypothetical protein